MIKNTLYAFVTAVIIATVWGAVVQTLFNLAHLAAIGVEISAGVRGGTILSDIFSGFTPTYGVYVVLPSLLVAFLLATLVIHRQQESRAPRRTAILWYTLAGGLAILLGNPVVNYLAPVALLVGATRDVSCLILMSAGGAVAGAVFAGMKPLRSWPDQPRPRRATRSPDPIVMPQ
ncbi:MAG TPA: hypothetical protein GX696_07430 [Pseudomonadaceae bacterium]|nr:hypothetical protein [Pseudomonadaceae bacterium]